MQGKRVTISGGNFNVASAFASDLDLDDPEFNRRKFKSFRAYAQSKAHDRLLTWAMARRLKDRDVTVNAMTPSLITATGLYRNVEPELVKRLTQYSGGRSPKARTRSSGWQAIRKWKV